jgi:hypothetical protein
LGQNAHKGHNAHTHNIASALIFCGIKFNYPGVSPSLIVNKSSFNCAVAIAASPSIVTYIKGVFSFQHQALSQMDNATISKTHLKTLGGGAVA